MEYSAHRARLRREHTVDLQTGFAVCRPSRRFRDFWPPSDGLLALGNQWPVATLRSCPISGSGRKKSSEQAADQFGRKIHHRDDTGVVEAGRSDDAKDAHHLALGVLKWGDDERRSRQ